MRRNTVNIVLVIGLAIWLAAFVVGVRSLVGDLPSWALQGWHFFGPAVIMVLVVRAWAARAGAARLMLKHPGETALLVGFAVWCVVVAVSGIPIVGFGAFTLLGPAALGSMAGGVYQARERTAPLYRQAVGLALILLGLFALNWTSSETAKLAYQWAAATQPSRGYPHLTRGHVPPFAHWMANAAGWFVPALLCGLGLRFWTNWSAARCLAWAAVVLGVPAATLLTFRLVLLTNPPLGT